MPTYRIKVVNRDFTSNEDIDALTPEAARADALRGALNIGIDEICGGKMFFGAEITIQVDDGAPERLMVAIGSSPLQ